MQTQNSAVENKNTNVQLVHKSSKDCAAYNTANADAIAMGLMLEWAPDAEIKAREEQAEKERQAGIIRTQQRADLLHAIWLQLPVNVQRHYTDPMVKVSNRSAGVALMGEGHPPVVVLESYTGNGWNARHEYYRLCVGDYGDASRLKLNKELTITPEQVQKCVNKIVEKVEAWLEKNKSEQAAAVQSKRNEAWRSDKNNYALACLVLGQDYLDSRAVTVHEDGRVTMQYKTLTVAQWNQVAQLKVAHAQALKDLFASFEAK
jgi:hypothetical protein